jgi:hypothetical protein
LLVDKIKELLEEDSNREDNPMENTDKTEEPTKKEIWRFLQRKVSSVEDFVDDSTESPDSKTKTRRKRARNELISLLTLIFLVLAIVYFGFQVITIVIAAIFWGGAFLAGEAG